MFFFFNDTATTEIYTLSLHDALPISCSASPGGRADLVGVGRFRLHPPERTGEPQVEHSPQTADPGQQEGRKARPRSEEHTSELQSRQYLVCRLLLEKKKHEKRLLA